MSHAVYFWGHLPAKDGSVGKSCLSQWFSAPFTVDELTFATAEHYMMYQKAICFGDQKTATAILEASLPDHAKRLGRNVAGFDDAIWNAVREEIVFTANLHKFTQNPALKAYLLSTGEQLLVEASPVDCIWGVGLMASDPAINDPSQWRGLNLLGKALMKVRATLSIKLQS